MGNSASHNQISLRKEISLCTKRQKFLNEALKRRRDLAYGQLKFNSCHQEVADAINTFIEKQNPSPSETPQYYTVELPEDDDDEVMENVSEGGLNTRSQGNNYMTEARQLAWINNNVPERTNVLEFLKALEGVEKQFRNAYESGKYVSKKLETESIENKPKSSQTLKLIRSLSRSSSRVRCSTFAESEIMGSTLRQLKLWEEKLYKDLKYEKEAMKSDKSNPHAETKKEEDQIIMVNAKIKVFQESAKNNSKKITELRDEQLLPKLVEQLDGMMVNWKAMSEFYETQKKIMSQVKESPPLLCNDVHREATKTLKEKLHNWCPSFALYISLQRAYVEALYCWLSKNSSPTLVSDNNGDWLGFLKILDSNTKTVTSEMKRFRKDVEALLAQQRKEHYQNKEIKRLENIVKHREEWISEIENDVEKISHEGDGAEIQRLKGKIEELKGEIEKFNGEIEENNEKLQCRMKKTQQMVNQFQTGFSKVFETLAEFSRKATEIYTELSNACARKDDHL